MQVWAVLLFWNDVHKQSSAKIHQVAVLNGKFVRFKFLNVYVSFPSILETKFRRSLTPADNIQGLPRMLDSSQGVGPSRWVKNSHHHHKFCVFPKELGEGGRRMEVERAGHVFLTFRMVTGRPTFRADP